MIKSRLLLGVISLVFLTSIVSCGDDPVDTSKTAMQIFKDLPVLGDDYTYEGWVTYEKGDKKVSTTVSIGRFNSGVPSIPMKIDGMEKATKYVLTIETATETGDDLKTPSGWKFAEGTFTKGVATISAADVLLYQKTETDGITKATGQFFLTSYPIGSPDEAYGVWFVDDIEPHSPPAKGGFEKLPKLTSKWIYEGWVVIKDKDGKPKAISTGRFSDPDKPDMSINKFKNKDSNVIIPFPGEDFYMDIVPKKFPKVTFPINLTIKGTKVVISIEPTENDKPTPFGLKPFITTIGDNQKAGVKTYLVNNFKKAISGTVTVK